jgi:hypothetical protein
MTNWTTVRNDAIAAAQGVLAGSWGAASTGATAQISILIQTGKYIEENIASMTVDEANLLVSQQKIVMQNILTAYESITIAAAINAVNAVIAVILTAAPGLAGFA